LLAPIALAAVEAGKHVLLEKPGARRAAELDAVALAARKNKVCVRVGFNHRYHPAFLKAREMVDEGDLGPLHLIRGRYGHGGRIGYDKEWRANPELSGGGQLIDQGVHLIDLARMFLGDFPVVQSSIATYFWDMPVEDNAFLLMRNSGGATAFLHTSCTEWKNLFSFEIFGKVGKLDISGLGGSYGTERITFYRMLPELGPPETTSWEYPMEDHSWSREWDAFVQDILLGRDASPGLADAQAALRIVERVYQNQDGGQPSSTGKTP
jgi:predicted dehydrogenase